MNYINRQTIAPGVIINVSKRQTNSTLGGWGKLSKGNVIRRKLGCATTLITSYIVIITPITISMFTEASIWYGIGFILISLYIISAYNNYSNKIKFYYWRNKAKRLAIKSEDNKRELLYNFVHGQEIEDSIAIEKEIIMRIYLKMDKDSSISLQTALTEHQQKLEIAKRHLKTELIDIDKSLSTEQQMAYSALCKHFNDLCHTDIAWLINRNPTTEIVTPHEASRLRRVKTTIESGSFAYLNSDYTIPMFDNSICRYYIYPQHIIRATSPCDFEIYPITDDTIKVEEVYFPDKEYKPQDAEQLSKVQSSRTNIPSYRYATITINTAGLSASFMVSNCKVAKAFGLEYASYANGVTTRKIISGTATNDHVNENIDYKTINTAASNLYIQLHKMSETASIRDLLNCEDQLADADPLNFTISSRLALIALLDVLRCYKELGYSYNLSGKEGVGLSIFIMKLCSSGSITESEIEMNGQGMKIASEFVNGFIDSVKFEFPADRFIVIDILRNANIDDDIIDQYAIRLYRFASILAKCDGHITETESSCLRNIMSFTKQGNNTNRSSSSQPMQKGDAERQLNELIGLEPVKDEVRRLTNFIRVQQLRQTKGMKCSPISYHCVFTGNPGTGKTTVARIVSEIYRDLGILKKGHLIETDRAGLVAEYVGQTAVKTNKIIDSALDGVLFIDEAYSLVQGGANDFGAEAIATLLKRMEDDRNRLVVILAGYGNEMKQFIDSNPGLQSRFNRYIHFIDYTADNLIDIFRLNIHKYDYILDPAAEFQLKVLFNNAIAHKDQNFGNGRYARNILEKVLENQASRLANEYNITEDTLRTILISDIPTF